MKKYIILLLTFSFILQNTYASNSFLYTKNIRGKIIDNFKEEQFKNIFLDDKNIFLNQDLNFFETQTKIASLQNIRSKASTQVSEDTKKLNTVNERIISLKEAIEEVESQIKETTEEIMSLNREIKTTIDDIKSKKENIKKLNLEIQASKKILLDYIAHIYKKGNIMYDDNSKIDSLKTVILNDGDISHILDDLNFTSILEFTGQSILQEYRDLLKEIFIQKLALEDKNNSLKKIREETIKKEKELQNKKDFREKILNFSQEQFEDFSQELDKTKNFENTLTLKVIQNKIKLKKQKKDLLSKYDCEYIDESLLFNNNFSQEMVSSGVSSSGTENKEDECLDLNKILTSESKLNPISKESGNSLSWPVYPTRGLSSYFRDPEYKNTVGSSHDAIDIRASQGTDIVAPADGYIIFLKPPVDTGYAYVALKHSDGIVTIYGHVSEILYNKYDYISAGTVFARVGGELGTPGAGGITSGAHLHLEVWQDKEVVDPLNYLDLTVLGENNIPKNDKYVYKFFDDYNKKFGIEYVGELTKIEGIFSLNGETEAERQKDLLSRYASPDFQNWDVWVEESMDANIDPSFAMCIGLAETSLGNRAKTLYNIGNVGNTDSGDTREFGSPRGGIYAMVSTLNNRFLGKYQNLSELSRYGNSNGSIYASSQDNWHNNNIKCLQALKGKFVADNFKFRLSN